MFNHQFRFVKATGSVYKATQCVPSALSAKSSLVTLILSWLLNVDTHFTAPASHNGLGNILNNGMLLPLTLFSLILQY
jgi:hypothetical protein